MGIKYLNQIIKKYCNETVETIFLNELFNKIISIDTSIFLYKYQYNESNYLISFLKQILKLLRNGITPFYIFDGKPPKEKNELLLERKIKKELSYAKIELLQIIKNNNEKIKNGEEPDISFKTIKYKNIKEEDVKKVYDKLIKNNVDEYTDDEIDKEIKKQNKKIINVRKEHIDDLIELLECVGIPYLKTNNEAEIVCAQLNKEKIVDGCFTEDSDYLTNSGNYLLRNFNINSKNVTLYKLHTLLKELELNNKQFVDFCILCGCDYTTKIIGIGSIKALSLIKKYKSIENIIHFINNNKTKYIVPDNFNYLKAREIFTTDIYCKSELNEIKKSIKIKKCDINKCIKFFDDKKLMISSSLLKELKNYNKYITKIIKYKNKKKQQKLTNYFTTTNDIISQEI